MSNLADLPVIKVAGYFAGEAVSPIRHECPKTDAFEAAH